MSNGAQTLQIGAHTIDIYIYMKRVRLQKNNAETVLGLDEEPNLRIRMDYVHYSKNILAFE